MLKLTVFLVVVLKVFCENVTEQLTYNLTVYKTTDFEVESATSTGKIELNSDAFHLILANQSVPKLFEGSVEINNELSILQILNSSLTDIDPGAFRIVPTLTLLRISLNLLTTIKSKVFNSIKVKEINLSNNFISVIEDDAFDNNTHLEILKLNYNAIKTISPDWFKNSPNVYKLSVIYNEVTKLPGDVFNNFIKTRPLKLRLSANKINEIDGAAFSGIQRVDILRLNGNKLATLPYEMFKNTSVKILQVNSNNLVCFPDSLYDSGLRSLAFLDNVGFNCTCLKKVKEFVERNYVDILYPAIICEDRAKEINLVYNFNKTYEIPLLPPLI